MCVCISYIESSVCVEQRYRHDHLCRVPERVFYFRPSDRPCCFVVGREFVRGRQHISKSSRRVSARVLRRGCGAEGRRRCRRRLCAMCERDSQSCQRFQCEQECCFSPPAVYASQSVKFRVGGGPPAGQILFCELGSRVQ